MHYTQDTLDWVYLGRYNTGWARAVVTLEEGDSAFNPATTKHNLYGPAVVTYEKYPDGGIALLEVERQEDFE